MKIKIIFFILFISSAAFAQEISQVPVDFAAYNQAIIRQNGAKASQYISTSTVSLYETLKDLALNADKKRFKKEPLSNQMNALLIRHKISCEELMKLDGKSLFAYVISHGFVPKEAIEVQSLGPIQNKSGNVEAPLLVNGKKIGTNLRFYPESNLWKVDLNSNIPLTSKGLKWGALAKGWSQDTLLLHIVETAKQAPLTKDLWAKPECSQ